MKIGIFGIALGSARDKEHEKLGVSGLGCRVLGFGAEAEERFGFGVWAYGSCGARLASCRDQETAVFSFLLLLKTRQNPENMLLTSPQPAL